MKKIISIASIFFILGINYSFGQQNFWNTISSKNSKQVSSQIKSRLHTPTKSLKLDLAYDRLINYLKETKGSSILLKFPNDKGSYSTYKIVETSNFSIELQSKFPNITSYTGYDVNDQNQRINFSISPEFGLYGSINNGTKNILIDVYTQDKSRYIIYDKSDLVNNTTEFKCDIDENESGLGLDNLNFKESKIISSKANDGNLKKFRLAITTTKEYSNYVIEQAGIESGTTEEKKAAILAAINVSMTRINSVLKNDVGVFLELIPNTDKLFFLSGNTFDTSNSEQMIEENIVITNNIIGASNYDIGHLFFQVNDDSNSNGLAYTPAVCYDDYKAGGVTGTVAPVGDAFNIDYTAHEMGHQFGATHTQNNNCNRSSSAAVEPGSGSTIMAYTGICPPNVQQHSDAYYHTKSIEEIHSTLNKISCGQSISTTNSAPIINTTLASSYTIPNSTAFALNVSATDTNNDVLTYTWEQMDPEVSNVTPPISSNTQGPNFRSFSPTTNGIRYFPKLEKIVNNQLIYDTNDYYSSVSDYDKNNWEIIPNNSRTMNFSVTVRDNNSNVGLTARKDVKVSFANVGPFQVTSQTTNEKWNKKSIKKITWDVAGTTTNGINTKNVKILLSTNGGESFDTTLAESVPNNGSYSFIVPETIDNTEQARIMIKAIDNIFLAINSSNFTITSSDQNETGYYIDIYPNPSNGIINISYSEDFIQGEISIVNILGQVVYSKQLTTDKFQTINLSNLTNGVYIVTVIFDGEITTKKIIIKK
ncbi:zinc-dependent metalloprotease [Chishuiella sp.]|uniref:zinc-dependent metalloprotease n=1 Tax=Chishuiella sp. TaxID=1969467 RepID=UPI0028AB0A9C|nr:zinc-dependent metalloprotease [Chishuiella sp.]